MWDDLWAALALVLVIEGLFPALAPQLYQRAVGAMAKMPAHSVRQTGMITMVIGAVLLYFIKN